MNPVSSPHYTSTNLPPIGQPRVYGKGPLIWLLVVIVVVIVVIIILSILLTPTPTTTTVTAAQYQSCTSTTNCESGLTCLQGTCTKACTSNLNCAGPTPAYCYTGVCVPGPTVPGGICAIDLQCPTIGTSIYKCIDSTCQLPCTGTPNCLNGQYCDSGVCVSGTVGVGESCKTTSQCDLGLVCSQTQLDTTPKCRAPCQLDPNSALGTCSTTFCDTFYLVCQ